VLTHQIISYFRFLFRSTNKHGIHSPFVYSLTTLCFNDRKKYPEYDLFKDYRHALLMDENEIEILDFGAGSRIFKGSQRKISRIARVAGLTRKRQRLLFRLSRYLKIERSLELGTSLGLGTIAIASGVPVSSVSTIEGCPETLKTAKHYFEKFNFKNIHPLNETFQEFFAKTDASTKFDLIYIDGDHSGKSTVQYFENLLKFTHNDTVIIFDDIYWSRGMTDAWHEIISRPEVTVSIDTFQWGMVFFRKEQRKQHFIIRV